MQLTNMVGNGIKRYKLKDLLPVLAECTELHLGRRKIERIQGFERFESLESLWLNNNQLQYVNNLDGCSCLREIYVQDNKICTLEGSIPRLKFLRTLDASNNQLSELSEVARILSRLASLKVLNLTGNPFCQDMNYRLIILGAVPSLEILDNHVVTRSERIQA
jgi:Leucine-rich repeat (LRR) protein